MHAHAGLSRLAISRRLRSSSRVQRQARVRRDASTSHADAGGYPSAEPLAKARARGVHDTTVKARRSPRARVAVPAFCDTRGLHRLHALARATDPAW